jgi:adenosylcobinamide-GDP ribazoletransferase
MAPDRVSANALAWFPVVGIVMGLTLSLAFVVLRSAFAPIVAAALVVALWAAITGALHLDGFADACDGLFAATTPARRLEILRDVHLGTFGAVGIVLLLIAQVSAVASLASFQPVLIAPVLGRWAMTYAAAYPLARNEGMAAMFRAHIRPRVIFAATIVAVVFAALFGAFGLAAFTAAVAIATLLARYAQNRLGGLTGDIYGMICESVELGVLLVGGLGIWNF